MRRASARDERLSNEGVCNGAGWAVSYACMLSTAKEIIISVVGGAILIIIMGTYRRWFGKQIAITYPRADDILSEPKPLGTGRTFPVRGTFKYLPKDHTVWLLIEDDQTAHVRPQNFEIIRDDVAKTWEGRIWGSGMGRVKIIAVIAPPTSQDFFRYYRHLGELRGHVYEPLQRIPPECRHRVSVQCRLP